ncbi:MAG: DNA topoisomerase VI subunit B [Deltaproteobacteria bacterium]|nr:DNA topoisomerase VI subunit B [Deltaproteobacteria bacterium]
MAASKHIREISISEFFAKNRHLLGFDNPLKALLTAVREAVDNSLDACEEAAIMPDITVEVRAEKGSHFVVSITDNGPGVSKAHLGNIFGKLLYGSKFHRLRQSRGQQGIGISAVVMYGQMTTGKPAVVITKTGPKAPAHEITLQLDTKKNKPKILKDKESKDPIWANRQSGTQITLHLEGAYKEGRHGILSYISQTALSNPHANLLYVDPKGKKHAFPRVMMTLPKEPSEIKRHPHGVELGLLMQLLHDAKKAPLSQFLKKEFSRISDAAAKEILKGAKLPMTRPSQNMTRPDVEKLYDSIQATKLMPPPTNCLSPMGEDNLMKALYWFFVESQRWDAEEQLSLVDSQAAQEDGKKGQSEIQFEATENSVLSRTLEADEDGAIASREDGYFVTAVTRSPFVYRGNPFQVEVGLFYGKGLKQDGLMQVYRYANRVPLQYQASGCAMTKAALSVPWKSYNLNQSKGALPTGPVVVMMHVASVWVPYTSESKEAIAHYPEILKEFRLALMECGRKLQRHLKHQKRQAEEAKKRGYIEKYLNPIGEALQAILKLSEKDKKKTVENLTYLLDKNYGQKKSEQKND